MKTLFATLLLAVGTVYGLFGQPTMQSIIKDPAFYNFMAKNVRYPAPASRANKVAKAYVNFTLTDAGNVTDITVLNTINVPTIFTYELERVLKLLPTQKPEYAGNYVVPVSFMMEGRGTSIKPTDESGAFIQNINKEALMSEVIVIGYTK